MTTTLQIIQIIFAVLLVAIILLQQRGSGLGIAFGAGQGNVYRSRRGIEKFLFIFTIIIAVLFSITAILTVFLG